MDVLGNVDNILVEVKQYNTAVKRELLRKVFYAGGFKYVYGYREQYGSSLASVTTLDGTMTDLTHVILGGDARPGHTHARGIVQHADYSCEDHWFTREPMPGSFMAPAGTRTSCL